MKKNSKQIKDSTKKHKKKLSKKQKVIYVLIAAVIAVIVSIGSYFMLRPDVDSLNSKDTEKTINAVKNINILYSNGKIEEAAAGYDKMISEEEDVFLKSIYTTDKAMLYFNYNDFDKALEIALESEKLNKNELNASLVAEIYEKKGEFEKSAEYYKKARDLLDKDDPIYDDYVAGYNYKIDRVENSVLDTDVVEADEESIDE